jgi:hypothetical protein
MNPGTAEVESRKPRAIADATGHHCRHTSDHQLRKVVEGHLPAERDERYEAQT